MTELGWAYDPTTAERSFARSAGGDPDVIHTTHDAHIHTGIDDPRCICVSDATNVRCPNFVSDIQTGLCADCKAARYPRSTAS